MKRTKYAIWNNGKLVPASKRHFKGAEPLTCTTAAERKLGLKWWAPSAEWMAR